MGEMVDCPQVPVSWGELVDKITILQIKRERIANVQARANVTAELTLLHGIAAEVMRHETLSGVIQQLEVVNRDLWEIEDNIREHEAARDFGRGFVRLARSVYRKNDRRAAIKRQINEMLGSALVEEKSYQSRAAAEGSSKRSTILPNQPRE